MDVEPAFRSTASMFFWTEALKMYERLGKGVCQIVALDSSRYGFQFFNNSGTVLAEHEISQTIMLEPNLKSEKSWVFTAYDTKQMEERTFGIRLPSTELSSEFEEVYSRCQRNKPIKTPKASVSPDPSSEEEEVLEAIAEEERDSPPPVVEEKPAPVVAVESKPAPVAKVTKSASDIERVLKEDFGYEGPTDQAPLFLKNAARKRLGLESLSTVAPSPLKAPATAAPGSVAESDPEMEVRMNRMKSLLSFRSESIPAEPPAEPEETLVAVAEEEEGEVEEVVEEEVETPPPMPPPSKGEASPPPPVMSVDLSGEFALEFDGEEAPSTPPAEPEPVYLPSPSARKRALEDLNLYNPTAQELYCRSFWQRTSLLELEEAEVVQLRRIFEYYCVFAGGMPEKMGRGRWLQLCKDSKLCGTMDEQRRMEIVFTEVLSRKATQVADGEEHRLYTEQKMNFHHFRLGLELLSLHESVESEQQHREILHRLVKEKVLSFASREAPSVSVQSLITPEVMELLEARREPLRKLFAHYSMVGFRGFGAQRGLTGRATQARKARKAISFQQFFVFCRDHGIFPDLLSKQQLFAAFRVSSLRHSVEDILTYPEFVEAICRCAVIGLGKFPYSARFTSDESRVEALLEGEIWLDLCNPKVRGAGGRGDGLQKVLEKTLPSWMGASPGSNSRRKAIR